MSERDDMDEELAAGVADTLPGVQVQHGGMVLGAPLRIVDGGGEGVPVGAVVAMLEDVLERARRGEVREIALVTASPTGHVGTVFHAPHVFTLMGGVEALRVRMADYYRSLLRQ
jgi:hypothetical protein